MTPLRCYESYIVEFLAGLLTIPPVPPLAPDTLARQSGYPAIYLRGCPAHKGKR